jgi:hypothetical protein
MKGKEMKGKEMNLEATLDKMSEAKLKKLLKTPRWWNLAQPGHLTDEPRLVGLAEGDRRKLSSGDLGKNGRDAINAALDRKKGKNKPKVRELTVNELLALMPKKKRDKILKSRKPGMLDEGPILKSRRGKALLPEGGYDEEEIEARLQLAKERKAAAKRRTFSTAGSPRLTPKAKAKPGARFNLEARHFEEEKALRKKRR